MKPQQRIRVLVIDDSAFSRRTISRMLEIIQLFEIDVPLTVDSTLTNMPSDQ